MNCFFNHDWEVIITESGESLGGYYKKGASITIVTYMCTKCKKIKQKILEGDVAKLVMDNSK